MKKRNLTVFTILVTFMLFNCDNLGYWRKGKAIGIKSMNEDLNEMIFIDDTIGFIFGSNWTDEAILSNKLNTGRTAVIYKTIDGGRSWEATALGDGTFTSASNVNDTLFVLKKAYFGEGADQVETFLFRSINRGETWEVINELSNGVYKISFCTNKTGIAFTAGFDSKFGRALLKTTNGGKDWEKLNIEFTDVRSFACSSKETVFFLSSTKLDESSADFVISMDLETGEEVIHKLPGFRADVLTLDTKEDLWLMGSNLENDIVLYKRDSIGEYSEIKAFSSKKSLFPEFLHVYDKSILILVSELDKSVLEEKDKIFPTAVKYKFFHSKDNGKTWVEEDIPVDYLIKPYAFYGKDKVWMNAGGGILQWRESPQNRRY
jgi:hypothetical protein